MDTLLNILAATPLFSGMTDEQLHQISRIAQDKKYKRGEAVFWEGEPANGFYVVVQGQVKIYKSSVEGKEQILHIYGPGNPFGEVPVFSGGRFPANATALEKSRLLFFARKDFIDLITAHPNLALNMLAVLSMRLRQFTVQVENLSLKEVPARLASYLIFLADEQACPDKVTLPVSKGQLASLLGTIPETLSRIFSKMTSQGFINVNGAEITITDKAGLEKLGISGRMEG